MTPKLTVTPATDFTCCAAAGIDASTLESTAAISAPRRSGIDFTNPDYAFPPARDLTWIKGARARPRSYWIAWTRIGRSKPLKVISPRSWKARPFPMQSSQTTFDTRLWSGCAWAQRRAASWTVEPKRSM